MSELRRTRVDRRRARRAGFTLIELMVSLTIGAMVIATVYTIGGSSARNFQEQQRIGQLQLSTRLALDRVRRDVERAGLHGTPNSAFERTCGNPVQPVQAVRIVDDASRAALSAYQGAAANTTAQADQLDLIGNFATSDAYLVRSFNGAGNVAFLQTQWQGFRRSFVDAGPTTTVASPINAQVFATVFAPGRMLHIQNMSGSHFFVTISSAMVAGDSASVTFAPALPVGGTCVVGLGEGALIAPLSLVRYSLSAAPADLVGLTDDLGVTGPNTALVRQEIRMADRTTVMNTRTVLEWAVHFDVDAVFDMRPGAGAAPTALQYVFMNDAAAAAQSVARPERVRSLAVTLGARTPEQDPDFPWVAPVAVDGVAPPLARFRVFTNRDGAARVRTASTEINIPNVANRGL